MSKQKKKKISNFYFLLFITFAKKVPTYEQYNWILLKNAIYVKSTYLYVVK